MRLRLVDVDGEQRQCRTRVQWAQGKLERSNCGEQQAWVWSQGRHLPARWGDCLMLEWPVRLSAASGSGGPCWANTSHLPEAGSVSDPGLFTPSSTTPFCITSLLLARQPLRQVSTPSDIISQSFSCGFSALLSHSRIRSDLRHCTPGSLSTPPSLLASRDLLRVDSYSPGFRLITLHHGSTKEDYQGD